jgi:hypothetical protein
MQVRPEAGTIYQQRASPVVRNTNPTLPKQNFNIFAP